MHGPDTTPTRITIDFSGSIHPARAWIIGRVDQHGGRVELLALDRPAADVAAAEAAAPARDSVQHATADERGRAPLEADCTCPEFCERDHANE
jgi:hypothetical protein